MLNLLAQIDISREFNSPFGNSALGGEKTVGDLVSLFLNGAFVIAGILVLILFLVGGFTIIAGASSDNPEAAKKGTSAITAAAIGFVVIFASYWIIRIIEIIAGTPFITEPKF